MKKGWNMFKKWSGCCFIYGTVFILFLGGIVYARAETPTERIRLKADKVMKILNDPAFLDKKEESKESIIEIIDQMIDWPEVSRRTLGFHWRKRTAQEKEDFINLFKVLLKKTYADKLELYSGEEIIYGAEKVDGKYAVVKTKIVNKNKGSEAIVIFRLRNKKETWLTYDVSVEGISMVNNYRVQFNDIIANSSYCELVKMIKNKSR